MTKDLTWPECYHGYYITPVHKCPWCFGGDRDRYVVVPQDKGNGWLLEKGRPACKKCQGPRHAGYGAVEPGTTQEQYWAEIEKIDHCLACAKVTRGEALAIYVIAARDWSDALEMILECADPYALKWLEQMLEHPGREGTDTDLNQLLLGPTKKRIEELANHV